jgi:hypothetical protein
MIFRGDTRSGYDAYALSVEPDSSQPTGAKLQILVTAQNNANVIIYCAAPTNQWTHFAVTLDANTGSLKVYTNGVVGVQTTTGIRSLGDLDPSSRPGLGIGNHSMQPGPWNFPFRGRMDEVSIYGRALSASEVKAIYQDGSAGKFDPGHAVPENLAKMQILLNGTTNIVFGQNTNWQAGFINFVAQTNLTTLEVDGLEPGMLVDDFQVDGGAAVLTYYVQPEDPYGLSGLTGKNAEGDWKLEIWDTRAGAFATNSPATLISWGLNFVFQSQVPLPEDAIHHVTETNSVGPGDFEYFVVKVPSWASFATNILTSTTPSLPLNIWFNQTAPPTGTSPGDVLLFSGTAVAFDTLQTNNPPAPLVPGSTYYIGVENPAGNGTTVTFGYQVDFDVTPLTLDVPVSAIESSNDVPRYFSYDVTSSETGVYFQLTNIVGGNVDLVASKTPFPDLNTFSYASFNPGTDDEGIVIFTNSDPVVLSPGRWYLGVFNRDATADVSYSIVVTDITDPLPNIILLENGVPYGNTNTSSITGTNDYYEFVVDTNAVKARFELYNQTNNMLLVARRGIPLPTANSFDVSSGTPGTNTQVILLVTNGVPVKLQPGQWFITAVNETNTPSSYIIKAQEWFDNPALVITNEVYGTNGFCITWTSLEGETYFVQGLPDLMDTNWVTIASDITGNSPTTTYCIPLPSIYHFFRVGEGIPAATSASVSFARVRITSIAKTGSGVQLNWAGDPNAKYNIEWSPTLNPPAWSTIPGTVTTTNGAGLFQYTDDGSQTGGSNGTKFYRLNQVP